MKECIGATLGDKPIRLEVPIDTRRIHYDQKAAPFDRTNNMEDNVAE